MQSSMVVADTSPARPFSKSTAISIPVGGPRSSRVLLRKRRRTSAKSDKQDELLKANDGDLVKAVKAAAPEPKTLWEAVKGKLDAIKFEDIEATVGDLSNKLKAYLDARKQMSAA